MSTASKFTEELFTEICRRVSEGETLASICRDAHMPHRSVVYDWLQADGKLAKRMDLARDLGADEIAEQCLRIADTPVAGISEKLERVAKPKDGENAPDEFEEVVTERRREDMLGHRKLQIETRLKLLAKWHPKRYGDKLDVDLNAKVRGSVSYRANLPPRRKPSE